MGHLISIKGAKKSFQMGETVVQALKGVELTVDKGEYLAVLGPSGSGKSTLMNIVGCMDHMDEGEYLLSGLPVQNMSEEQLTVVRNLMIGFVFQRYHLIPTYTVLQNVMMPLLVRGMSHKEAAVLAMKQLKLLDMDKRINHKPHELSGGQQQRVAIARALVGTPKLLLADEPTGALDMATGQDVMRLFSQLSDMGHTIVMITHDRNIAKHARRVVYIVDGQIYNEPPEGFE